MQAKLDARAANGGVLVRDPASRGSTVPGGPFSSDASLAARARRGDRRALRALYGRYAAEVHDFALRVAGAGEAPAAVSGTFASAWDRLRVGVQPPRVEPWLFGIAREIALERAGRAPVVLPEARGSAGHGAVLARAWAETLTPREYALVDLYVRRGLSVRELAEITGASQRSVRDRIERLGAELDGFATVERLVRRPGSCPALAALLHRAGGAEAIEVRRAVRSHARLCPLCGVASLRPASALTALAELPSAPLPAEVSDAAWGAVAAHAGGRAGVTPRSSPTARTGRHGRLVAAVALGGCAVAGALAVAFLDPFGGTSPEPRTAAPAKPRIGKPQSVFRPPVAARSTTTGEETPSQETTPAQTPTAKPANGTGGTAQAEKPRSTPPAQPEQETPGPAVTRPAGSKQAPIDLPDVPVPANPHPGARTLAWAPVTGAVAYEVVLVRDQRQVYRERSQEARTVLPRTWTYEGRPMELETGTYRWIVWAIMAGGKRADKAIVVSDLHID